MTNIELEEMLLNPDTIIRLANNLKVERQKNAELQQKINNRYVKADKDEVTDLLKCFSEIALQCNLPPREFTQKLVDENYLYRKNGKLLPNPNHMGQGEGLFEIKAWASQTVLTEKGQKFFLEKLQPALPVCLPARQAGQIAPKIDCKVAILQEYSPIRLLEWGREIYIGKHSPIRLLEWGHEIYIVAKDIAKRYKYEGTLEMLIINKFPTKAVKTNTVENSKQYKQYIVLTADNALTIADKHSDNIFVDYLCYLLREYDCEYALNKGTKSELSFMWWLEMATKKFESEQWYISHYGKQQIRWREYNGEIWVILKDVALALKFGNQNPTARAKQQLKKNSLSSCEVELKKITVPNSPTKAIVIRDVDIDKLAHSKMPHQDLEIFGNWLGTEIETNYRKR